MTTYDYDPATFRLRRLQTRRGAERMQDLSYSYDPVGNITHIEDAAQQAIFFRNTRVEPSNYYRYDATYRLVEATGREHLGQIGGAPGPIGPRAGRSSPATGPRWAATGALPLRRRSATCWRCGTPAATPPTRAGPAPTR